MTGTIDFLTIIEGNMALLIKTDRTVQVMNGELSITDMQGLVGGYVQCVPLNPLLEIDGKKYVYLMCDEDGKSKNYPANYIVSGYLVGTRIDSSDSIVGDVLLLEDNEMS